MPILPCGVPTTPPWAGATALSWMSPWWRQSARPPERHNALAASQKTPTLVADHGPTYPRPYPPLPGKCDGTEGTGQFQHHLALCCRPGRRPDSGPGSVHRQPLGDVRGQHILILTASASCEAVPSPLLAWGLSDLRGDGKRRPVGDMGRWSCDMPLSGLGRDPLSPRSPKREGDFPPHPATTRGPRVASPAPHVALKMYASSCGPVAVRGNPNLAEELTLGSLSPASGSLSSL